MSEKLSEKARRLFPNMGLEPVFEDMEALEISVFNAEKLIDAYIQSIQGDGYVPYSDLRRSLYVIQDELRKVIK